MPFTLYWHLPQVHTQFRWPLCDVMLNNVSYQLHIHPFDYQGIYDELSKNEQELRFS